MFKNIGSSWLLLLLTVGATYLIMPFSIKVLGEGAYGTFLLITSTTNYLSLLMMGVPMATVRHLAKLSAEGKPEEVNRAIGSCLVLFLGMSVTSLLAGGLLYLFFDQTYALSGALRQEARLAFALTVLWASAGFVGQLLNAILAAHRDFVVRSAILTASLLLRLGLTFGLLSLKPSIVWLAAVQVIVLVFEGVTMWAVIQRRHPGTRISLRDFDRGLIRR